MKTRSFLFLTGIIFLTIFAYRDCVKNNFVFDDHCFVEKNPHIKSLKNITRFFTTPLSTTASIKWKGIYRPLRTLSYALEYKLYKLNPDGYHLTNLLLHILNITLVFTFLNLLINEKKIAILATFLFALHPVQSEAVLWIGSRADLLLGFFELLAVITFLRFIRTGNRKYYWWSIVHFILALLSKETAITTPLIFAMLLFALNKKVDKKIVLLPFIIAIVYLPIRIYLMQGFAQREWWGGSFATNFLTAIKLISHYIYLLIFPYHLSVDYGFKPAQSFFDPLVITSVLIISVLLWWSYKCRKSGQNMHWLGIAWFFILLAPCLNFIPITTITGDRFLYLSSLGLFLSSSSIIFSLKTNQIKTISFFLVFVLAITYVSTIRKRTREWNNDYTLFASVLKYNPNSWMSYQNLGTWYYQRKDYENAKKYFLKAKKIRGDDALTCKSLGLIYLETGKIDKAQKYFLKALLLNPRDIEMGNLVAITLELQKKYGIAEELYRRYLEIDPQNQNIKRNLYSLYFRLKKFRKNSSQTGQRLQ